MLLSFVEEEGEGECVWGGREMLNWKSGERSGVCAVRQAK